MIKYILGAALSVTLLAAVQASAASAPLPTMTQLEFLQWLVQLSGDTSTVPANAAPADYIQWAQGQGITPAGGWDPNAILTRDVLAQALVQFFNLNVKAGSDAIRALQREGIDLPGGNDASRISRRDFVSLLNGDGGGFVSRSQVLPHSKKHSKAKTPTKGHTPPKKETRPRHDNGNNNIDGNNGLDGPGTRTRPRNQPPS